MVRRRRRGVYAVIKKGRRYWEFKAKVPHTGEWFTQSVSKKLMRDLGIEATGRDGTINEKDAQTVRALFERELDGLVSQESQALREATPLSELFDRYLNARCTRNGPAVLDRKKAIFEDFLTAFGDLPAHEVTEEQAASFLKRLITKGTSKGAKALAATTARDYFRYLKAAFEFGRHRHLGILRMNPATYVELPEKQEPDTPIWTPAQIHDRLETDFADPRWEYFRWIVVGSFVTGLSPMEWQGADWTDYVPDRRAIWISEVKKKSSAIRRTEVPVPALFLPAFEQRQGERGPIWPTSTGKRFGKNSADSVRARVKKKWPGFNFLSMRKSYSDFLQSRDVYDMQLARLLRHGDGVESGYRVARKHYSRRRDFEAVRGVADQAFDVLGDLLKLVSNDGGRGRQLRLSKPA